MAENAIDGNLALVGGGKMGRALVQGMLAAGVIETSRVAVVDPDPVSADWWKKHLPNVTVHPEPAAAVTDASIVILAVKPGVVSKVASTEGILWQEKLVISVAAGIALSALSRWLSSDCVVRVMPNTPALVGAGASAFACADGVSERQVETVEMIFKAVGLVARVDEAAIDAVTGLSGSGPAYVFVAIEALADGGVAAGLPRDLAQRLAAQTVMGAAKLMIDTGEHPAALKDAVASPGGTTIAGLAALEQNGFRSALIQAVQAATARSRALGEHRA